MLTDLRIIHNFSMLLYYYAMRMGHYIQEVQILLCKLSNWKIRGKLVSYNSSATSLHRARWRLPLTFFDNDAFNCCQ